MTVEKEGQKVKVLSVCECSIVLVTCVYVFLMLTASEGEVKTISRLLGPSDSSPPVSRLEFIHLSRLHGPIRRRGNA